MNWTKASAIAEILSSVAVLITLLYLVVEIGQNTAALEAASRQSALDNTLQVLQVGIDSPELWLSRVEEDLTDTERVRLSALLFGAVRRGQVAWQQYQEGALDEAGWIDVRRAMIGNLQYSQPRKWWDYNGPIFPPDFQNLVNELLSDTPIDTQMNDIEAFD